MKLSPSSLNSLDVKNIASCRIWPISTLKYNWICIFKIKVKIWIGQQKLAVNDISENIFKIVELFLSINGVFHMRHHVRPFPWLVDVILIYRLNYYMFLTFNPIVVIITLEHCWMLPLKCNPSSISVIKNVDYEKFENQLVRNLSRITKIAVDFHFNFRVIT